MFEPRKQRENWKNWHTYTYKRHNIQQIYTAEGIRVAYCGIKRFENPRTPAPLHVILMFNKLLRGCLITF